MKTTRLSDFPNRLPWRSLLIAVIGTVLAACGTGDSQDPDPLVEDFGIAFVMRPLELDNNGMAEQADLRELSGFTPGGDLYYRDLAAPSAPEHNITGAMTGGMGDVKDIEVSYDGKRLLFALRMPDIDGLDPEDQPRWNLWEYSIENDTLVSVLPAGIIAEGGNDMAPHYLPDGRIVFSSDRQSLSRALLLDENKPQFPAQEESRNESAMLLHVAQVTRNSTTGDIDGFIDVEQLSMNQSHDLDATVLSSPFDPLRSGRIVFTRWDNMGGRSAMHLYGIDPDGTGLELLYGAHSHDTGTNGASVQFVQPREMEDGRLLTVVLPFTDTHLGGELMVIDIASYLDNTQPTAINQGILFGPAQEDITINDVTNDGSLSPGGRYRSAWPLLDGTGRLLVSWSSCRLDIDGIIGPCTEESLADPLAIEADPIYGIFLYDTGSDTSLPIVAPQEGVIFTDVVAASPRPIPGVIASALPGFDLDQQAFDEGTGFIDIRSVYDVDGVDTTPAGIAVMADPAQTAPDQRPARFLRIVKAVSIPDNDFQDVPNTAYGRSAQQLMREIIGYVPVQPDGSVRARVPANVPLAISVVDSSGRRISDRHQNWLQVRPGETLVCNGCHEHADGIPHGMAQGPASVWPGAQATGVPFPNTLPVLSPDFMETMAKTLTRIQAGSDLPTVDVIYNDAWTGDDSDDFALTYAGLDTPAPASPGCQTTWTPLCRTVIHYETHIHPLWSLERGVNTCTDCHNNVDGDGMDMVPMGLMQLDLGDGPDQDVPEHYKAYRELLFTDFEQEIGAGGLQDIQDPNRHPIGPPMSSAGAHASSAFFAPFENGGTHDGRLTPAELRLIAEWLDIGAQYYNDPFVVPQ